MSSVARRVGFILRAHSRYLAFAASTHHYKVDSDDRYAISFLFSHAEDMRHGLSRASRLRQRMIISGARTGRFADNAERCFSALSRDADMLSI